MDYNRPSMAKTAANSTREVPDEEECGKVREYLRSRTGLTLRSDKRDELPGIIGSRLADRYPALSFPEYFALLARQGEAGAELRYLVSRLTVGETHFFRNRPQFDALRKVILPDLVKAKRSTDMTLSIWSAGCSTGEEPYSIAMLLVELIPDIVDWKVSILATDINEEALAAAREGRYRNWSFREVDEHYRSRYFAAEEKRWKIHPQIVKMVTFRYLNLADDIYPSAVTGTDRLDLITCRNVMIYFRPEVSLQVTGRFHRCLREGCYLLVGHGEHSEMVSPAFQRKLLDSAIVYQKGTAGPQWERGIKLRFRGAGAASPDLLSHRSGSAMGRRGVQRPADTEETVLFEKAVSLYREKRLEDSLGIFRQIVKLNGNNERARYMTALITADLGDLEEAAEEAQALLAKNPLHLETIYLLALVARIRGDSDGELGYLRKAVYLNPSFVLGHFQMAVHHLREGRDRFARRSLLNVLDHLAHRSDGDPVDGAGGKSLRQVLDVRLGRDEDQRDLAQGRIALETTAGLETVYLGHHHVEQHEIRQNGRRDAQRLLPAGGEEDLMAERCQHLPEQVQVSGLVVDDE